MQPTRARHGILALIAIATMLNYLDRTLLSVAAPAISGELGIGPEAMGIVFSVFSWSYALAQIPGGVLLDRFGTRLVYGVSLVAWSLFTAMQGAVTSVAALIGVRLGLGAAEAPCFPANSRVLVTWFPRRERARANSVYSVGMYFGIAFLSPLLYFISSRFGWRALFASVGLVGIAFGVLWFRRYRDPAAHPTVNAAERALIDADDGHTQVAAAEPFRWSNVRYLLSQRQIIGASIGQFATNSTLVFFLTWFPTYLAVERQMSWIKVGFVAVLPFVAASVGVLFGGWISDRIVTRTGSATLGRKLPIVCGLLLSACILSAIRLESNALIIAVLCVAFFGQGMSNLGWTLLSEVAPRKLIGLSGGVFNFCTNLAGIVTPIVIGFLLARTGSFLGGLAYIGVAALVGALAYVFIVGKVQRLPDP